MQFKTFINAQIPRIKSKYGTIESVKTPWASEGNRHTYLFEILIIDWLLATKNQTKTAQMLRCGFNLVNRIIHVASQRGIERRDKNTVYQQLSLDEKAFQKGHNYVTVLSDPMTGVVIDIVKNRTKKACKMLLENALSEFQKSKVETISLDMWKAFNTTVDEVLPKAKKVHDRFHLIKYLNEAIDQVRRREVKKNEVLVNSRYSFLKNTSNLTKNQYFKFEEVLRLNTAVGYVWGLKESFLDKFSLFDLSQMQCKFCLAFLQCYLLLILKFKTMYSNLKITTKMLLGLVVLIPVLAFNSITNNVQSEKVIVIQNDKILIGKWITEDKDVIEFYQNNKTFEGKIVSLGDKEAVKKNPEIIGAVIFKKLELVKGEFINGSYYDIESKESYKVSIKISSAKLIKLKFGSGLFSQTSEFKKVN